MEELFDSLFKKFHLRHSIKTLVIGKVTDITDTNCRVTRDGQPDLVNVRLHAVEDNLETFILVKPKEGSYVIAGIIENDRSEAAILATSEIAAVMVKAGNLHFEIDGDKFLLKKGDENLGKLMGDMIDAMKLERHMTNTGITINLTAESITRYNDIKSRFNNLLKNA